MWTGLDGIVLLLDFNMFQDIYEIISTIKVVNGACYTIKQIINNYSNVLEQFNIFLMLKN